MVFTCGLSLRSLFVGCLFLGIAGCGRTGSGSNDGQTPPKVDASKTKEMVKEFSSADGRFKVQMPGTPKEETYTVAGATAKTFTFAEKDGAYVVSFADLPIPKGESEAQLQARLDGARDGMVQNVGGIRTSDSRITLSGKYPGREVQADIPSKRGFLRARIYLVDRRLYQMTITGTKSWSTSADATKFLDSLVLTL